MAQIAKVCMGLGAEHDLTVPTATRQYPLGYEVLIEDPTKTMTTKYVYVKAHDTLTAYVPYQLVASATAGAEVTTQAGVAVGAPGGICVIPQVAFTASYYGFVAIEGYAVAAISDSAWTAGDYLQYYGTSAVTLSLDGTSGSSPFTANTCACALAGGSVAGNCAVMLLRGKAVIVGS